MRNALAATNPITLAIALLVLAFSLAAALLVAILSVLAIPLMAVLFYGSMAHLLIKSVCHRPQRANPEKVVDIVLDEPVEQEETDPMFGWTFIPAGEEQPMSEPEPVLVCSPKDALAAIKKSAKPTKAYLNSMPTEDLFVLAKRMGLKGISSRMKRDTLLWRITTHK